MYGAGVGGVAAAGFGAKKIQGAWAKRKLRKRLAKQQKDREVEFTFEDESPSTMSLVKATPIDDEAAKGAAVVVEGTIVAGKGQSACLCKCKQEAPTASAVVVDDEKPSAKR